MNIRLTIFFALPSASPAGVDRGRGIYGLGRGRKDSHILSLKNFRLYVFFSPPSASPGGYQRSNEEEQRAQAHGHHEGQDVAAAGLPVRALHPHAQDQRQHEAQLWHP